MRFDYFVMANGKADEKIAPTFLSVIAPKTLNLHNLLQSTKPGLKT